MTGARGCGPRYLLSGPSHCHTLVRDVVDFPPAHIGTVPFITLEIFLQYRFHCMDLGHRLISKLIFGGRAVQSPKDIPRFEYLIVCRCHQILKGPEIFIRIFMPR